jgi:thioredoxin-related protein
MNKLRIFSVILVLILMQACSRSETQASKTPETNKPETSPATELPEQEAQEATVGDDLSQLFSEFKVKDEKMSVKKLSSVIDNKESLIIFVKPGCVFCESLLAVMSSQKTKPGPKLIIAMDAAHAKPEEFQAKRKKNSEIKADWVYDFENKFHDRLAMNSFPRFLHLDKKLLVVENQIGLRLPENKAALEGLEFPVVLQKLSLNTVDWIESL